MARPRKTSRRPPRSSADDPDVRHGSGIREEQGDRFEAGLIRKCWVCQEVVWWRRPDWTPICSTCHPPTKPSIVFAVAAARRLGVPAIVGPARHHRADVRGKKGNDEPNPFE